MGDAANDLLVPVDSVRAAGGSADRPGGRTGWQLGPGDSGRPLRVLALDPDDELGARPAARCAVRARRDARRPQRPGPSGPATRGRAAHRRAGGRRHGGPADGQNALATARPVTVAATARPRQRSTDGRAREGSRHARARQPRACGLPGDRRPLRRCADPWRRRRRRQSARRRAQPARPRRPLPVADR